MRTTVTINDELFKTAAKLTGLKDPSALIQEGLTALIERESARHLATLGGSDPRLSKVSKGSSETAE